MSTLILQPYRFEIALSFASDGKRPAVRTVAELLRRQLGDGKVFLDEWFEHELAGHDAQIVLQKVYRSEARLVVACVCKRYNEKPWAQEEWRAIQAFERTLRDAAGANRERARLLLLRFGDGEVDGIFDTAIVPDVRSRTTEQIADLILRRWRLTQGESSAGAAAESPNESNQPRVLSSVGVDKEPVRGITGKRSEHVTSMTSLDTHIPESLKTVRATDGDARAPKIVDLALAQAGEVVRVTVCLTSDESTHLAAEVSSWRDRLARDPLLPAGVKARVRKANLQDLFADNICHSRLYDWLSTTTFSLYVYFAASSALVPMGSQESARRLQLEPVIDRLRKRSELIATIRSGSPDLVRVVAPAIAQLADERPASPIPFSTPAIIQSRRGEDPFVTLAEIVAEIIARHLADRGDEIASANFECVSTRLRFAKDVSSGEIHTRSRNPLT